MKIIKLKHDRWDDYYDRAAGFGVDESLRYVRERKVIETDFVFPERSVGEQILGFCGKLYPVIHRTVAHKSGGKHGVPEHVRYEHFNFYSVDEYLESQYYFEEQRTTLYRRKNLRQFFHDWSKEDDSLFVKFKVPVFVLKVPSMTASPRRVPGTYQFYADAILNPNLTEYHFYRQVDAFSTFQNIAQYLSNQLVETKEIIQIEDKYLIENHGYDKFSFRHPVKLKDL